MKYSKFFTMITFIFSLGILFSQGKPMSSGVYSIMLSKGKTLEAHKIMLIK